MMDPTTLNSTDLGAHSESKLRTLSFGDGGWMESMTPADWHEMAKSIAQGEMRGELLKKRGNDVMVMRVPIHNSRHVIAKLWNRPTWKGAARRLTRTNSGFREWQILQRLREFGLSVPRPLAYVELHDPDSHYTEALLSEDLGLCRNLGVVVKDLIRHCDEMQINLLEQELIGITEAMIQGGVLDRDHRVSNFVQRPSGQVTRIDFELASYVNWYSRWRGHHGIMLGTLIGSYVFFTQPNTQRAVAFARCLMKRLNPPHRVLQRSDRVIQAMLQVQRRERNIDTSFPSMI